MRAAPYAIIALGLGVIAGSCRTSAPNLAFVNVPRALTVSDAADGSACIDVAPATEKNTISRVCAGPGADDIDLVRVTVAASVRCLRVTESGGSHLAFVAAGDEATRTLVELQPVSQSASFGVDREALRLEPADPAASPFALGTGRLKLEAFNHECWQVCANQHGTFTVELGEQRPRAYSSSEGPCQVLSHHAFAPNSTDAGGSVAGATSG